jgi:hypothetical protein
MAMVVFAIWLVVSAVCSVAVWAWRSMAGQTFVGELRRELDREPTPLMGRHDAAA